VTAKALATAGWATLALVLLLALGGAASRPGGHLLGLPRVLECAAVVAALLLIGAITGFEAGRWCLGLLPIAVVLLSGLGFPGAMAFSGPPLLALAAGAVVLMLSAAGRRPPRWTFFPIVLALYLVVSFRTQRQVGPEGDEPHYLMVAESILRDGDLSLEKDYAEERYRAFADRPLSPHYRVRGKDGRIYSLHSIGLSLLILPAYAFGGYPAVSFFMALLAALLAREVRELLGGLCEDQAACEGVAWAVALSPPLIHYAGLVFTEVPAALAVALGLRLGRRGVSTIPGALTWGAAVGLLPWLHFRYAPLAAILVLYALGRREGRRLAVVALAVCGLSALGIALYHQWIYGSFDPRVVWGRRPELSFATLPEGLPGLLLDQEFGLLVYAPVFALCVPGFVGLLSRRRREGLAALALATVVFLMAGSWHMWRGGFNPPGRFLVPLVPVLALALVSRLRSGLAPAAALLLGWSVWTGLAGAWEPRLVHRDRDGTAPFFRAFSGAEEWTRLLPGYVLPEDLPDRGRLALVWGLTLAVVVLPRRSAPASAVRLGAAVAGAIGACVVASRLSHARTGGRDAARLLGQPAVAIPGWQWTASADACWSPQDVTWGPVYEPHRHPSGAEIGSRLALAPGPYAFELKGQALTQQPPALAVRPEGVARSDVPLPLDRSTLVATLRVEPGERAVSLFLTGGGALTWEEACLKASTFP
jgi:hypothetical protein